jgi:hypothetical protein
MKILQDFEDYSLDLLVEAITQKEIPLIFSDRFRGLIKKINHPISIRLQHSEFKSDKQHKSSFIDLDDSGLDKISFITATKAAEVVGNYKYLDKEKRDIEFDTLTYLNANRDDRLKDLLYSKYRSVTTIGKLINKLFPKEFEAGGKPGQDIQSFTDKFKSMRDFKELEEVKGDDIVKYYNYENYVGGDDAVGTLGNSCMRYDECSNYIQFYADNPMVCSLLILKNDKKENEDDEDDEDYDEDKIKGRALVWKLSQPKERIFMDRIYTIDAYDEELFKAHAKKNGWLYKYRQNSSDSEWIIDGKDDSKEYMILKVSGVKHSSTGQYPYVDTVKYFYVDDDVLSNSDDLGGDKYTLQDTDGGYEEDEGIYVDFYGRSYPEEDLIYCDLGDEYRLEEDAVYLDFYGEHATQEYIDRRMVQCDYYEGYGTDASYRVSSDTVNVYGTDETACSQYASNNMVYSDYHNDYLPEGHEVYSEHHESYLYDDEAVEVYLDEGQRKTDWRAEDDGTWWEWDYDNEKYDEDVSIEELRAYHDLDENDEEIVEEEEKKD